MDWLKDKKNLPIVVGLAVFVLLAAGGLVAAEMGVFAGQPAEVAPVAAVPAGTTPPGSPGTALPGSPGMASPSRMTPPGSPRGASPAVKTASVAPKLTNPAVGPDPFNIPNGQKTFARQVIAQASKQTGGQAGSPPAILLPLRDILPKFDLFTLPSPAPPPTAAGPGADAGAQNYRLTAILNSDGGILAILETNGQSQQVKPGDGLPDGGKVLSIEASSVTLRTPGGSTVSIPLTSGAGPTDQTQNGQDPNAGNLPGQPMDAPGQPFGQ